MEKPLKGVKVLDLSRILAGPLAAQSLADLGAEVLKVEAPWGDDTRTWAPPMTTGFDGEQVAAYWLSCNRGKRIIKMNLKKQASEVRALIDDVDIVIENFRPGTLERLIGKIPDSVILCSITAFGQDGPRAMEPGFDLALQARSGIMSITGTPDGEPSKVGVAWIDVMTGQNAVSAILAALFHRERTGVCRHIDINLWDTALAALVNQAQNRLASGIDPAPMGSAHPNLCPYRAFEASDGWFVIAVGSDAQFEKLCTCLGIELLESWKDNPGRVSDRDSVESAVQKAVSTRTRVELERILEGIPCSPINTVGEALMDQQSIEREIVTEFNGVPVLASPLRSLWTKPES